MELVIRKLIEQSGNKLGMERMLDLCVLDPALCYVSVRSELRSLTPIAQVIAIHDGFKGTRRWFDFPSSSSFQDFPIDKNSNTISGSYPVYEAERDRSGGMDRVAIDSHRYLAFSEPDLRSVREQVLKVSHSLDVALE